MTTEEREETQSENERDPIANGTQELAALHARIAPHFRRAEVRERVGRFLRGLLRAPAEIKVAAIVVEWYSSILHEKDF